MFQTLFSLRKSPLTFITNRTHLTFNDGNSINTTKALPQECFSSTIIVYPMMLPFGTDGSTVKTVN